MTSLAGREMTEQEMVNTCTAPQMAHLIQVLRQTIRNKDKEIERWVDMVSQLQRDGELDPPEPKPLLADAKVGDLCKTDLDEWIQIDDAPEPPSPILYHIDRPFKGNIIHTEPLAPEGTAEWAWQMLKLGKPVTNKWVFTAGGYVKDTDSDKYRFVQMWDFFSDWQLYELEPEPKFAVGDWVEFRDIEGIKHGLIEGRREEYSVLYNGVSQSVGDKFIIRKLDPSEIVLEFGNGIKGTIRRYRGEQIRIYDGDINFACLAISYVTEPLQTTVRKLLKAQEEQ